jgi:hypothetical protein
MSGDDPKPATGDFFPAERPVVDPGSVDAKAPEPASGKRKRTGGSARIRAGTPKVQVEVRSLDLSKLERLFVGVHLLLAQNTNTPELAITQVEAHDFFDCWKEVAKYYDVRLAQKTIDWSALIGTTAAIYGSRFVDIQIRRKAEQSERRGIGRVVPFPGPVNPPPPPDNMPPAVHVPPIMDRIEPTPDDAA